MFVLFIVILTIFEILLLGALFWVLIKIGLWRFLDKILPFSFFRENYDGSMNLNRVTYQGQAIWLFILMGSFSIIFLFLDVENPGIRFGMFLSFFLPSLLLLIRIHTFNDSNILPETGFGYDSFNCWKFSCLSTIPGFMFGISGLFFSMIPLYVLLLIPLACICCLVPIFPDYVNRYLSYDIRSKRGIEFLRTFSVFAFVIQILIFGFL
ncbi:MAG: hypothetical protein ACRC1M_07505 [Methanobacteriaceae archaeon]